MMMRATAIGASLLLVLLACAGTAAAATDCRLTALATLRPEPGTSRLIVPATLDGRPGRILLDMEDWQSEVSSRVFSALNLPRYGAPVAFRTIRTDDPTGQGSSWARNNDITEYREVSLGGWTVKDLKAFIVHDPLQGTELRLGNRFLDSVDMEFDLSHDTIRLFSPDHCPGRVVYWSASHLVLPYRYLPTGKLVIDAKLDGRPVKARLAPGITRSGIEGGAMAGLGLAADSNGKVAVASLEFGGVRVPNLSLSVIRHPIKAQDMPGELDPGIRLEAKPWQIRIGGDILRLFRIYFARREAKAYFTLAGAR